MHDAALSAGPRDACIRIDSSTCWYIRRGVIAERQLTGIASFRAARRQGTGSCCETVPRQRENSVACEAPSFGETRVGIGATHRSRPHPTRIPQEPCDESVPGRRFSIQVRQSATLPRNAPARLAKRRSLTVTYSATIRSTRRFLARPSAVSLLSTGRASP